MMQMPTRNTQTGWVTHRIHNPGNTPLGDNDRPRIKRPTLHHSRNRYQLMQALLEEIEEGNSLTKLYATLLAKTMLESDPKLESKYRQRLMSVTE
jgi:hypothetical protein